MNSALYHYWTLPPRFRRWPYPVRWGVGVVLVALALALSAIPLLVWRSAHAWAGMAGYDVLNFGMLFFLLVNLASGMAGATRIAKERERGTWESLLLTPLGVRAILRTKLLSCLVFAMGMAALTLPFWLGWAYQVLEVNGSSDHPLYQSGEMTAAQAEARMGLFLFWLALRIVGRVLPFIAIGMAISARCNQTRRALVLTSGLILGLSVAAWSALGLATLLSAPDLPTSLPGRIFCWILLPNDFMNYPATGLLSRLWRADLIADAFWLLLVPLVCFQLATRWSRQAIPPMDVWERERRLPRD